MCARRCAMCAILSASTWEMFCKQKRVTFCFVNKRVSWSVLMVERFVIGFQVERKRTLETLRSAPLYRRISLAIRSLGLRPRLRHYAPPWSVNGRGASSRVVGHSYDRNLCKSNSLCDHYRDGKIKRIINSITKV